MVTLAWWACSANRARACRPLTRRPRFLSDGTADHRADLYSAAVLLWEVLSGASLFGDADVSAILARQLAGPMPRPVVRAAWAEPLVDIVMRGLSVNPSDRPEAASDFASAIRLVSQARLAATTRVGRTVEALAEEALAMRRLGQPAAISSSGLHRSMSPSSGAIRAAAPPIAGHASRPGEGKSHPDDEVTSQRATPPRKSDRFLVGDGRNQGPKACHADR